MIKRWMVALLFSGTALTASSQTLFTYGKYNADAQDFLRAYNKNNAQPAGDRGKAMREYLDLYINSRLKIQEAYARQYDTLAQIKSEVDNLRAQIIENYMSDPNAINRLTKEAFHRSQKDIHVAHIFISFTSSTGAIDTIAAKQKLQAAQARLEKGEEFLKVAQSVSDAPDAKTSSGDIGFVTVLTLPYAFENIIYNTEPGKVSKPFTSRAGYHIFKNIGERKAVGKIKIQQILLAFPPDATEALKAKIGNQADSLYKRIMAGDDFSSLATRFSNDYISAATGGNIPDIGVGQFEPAFEKIIWGLPKDGAVAKPFRTAHGYHIVKRIAIKPVNTDASDKTAMDDLQAKIMSDDRWKTARDFIYERVKAKPGFKALYNQTALWSYSDSVLDFKPGALGRSIDQSTPVFGIGDSIITTRSWITYAQSYRYKADRTPKALTELMDEFAKSTMYDYYRAHLEDYSEEFRIQMQEFRDGNLFFEIMQQEIWNRTQTDSAALLSLFEKNKAKYNWLPSADAVIFFCSDAASAKTLYDQMKKEPGKWKKNADALSEKVVADSSRYEWAQLPGLDKSTPKAGMLTPQVVNPTDNTSSFAYILKVYTTLTPRNFNEAKGLVMNDYQAILEEQWIKELRKKYPVVVNQKVLDEISR